MKKLLLFISIASLMMLQACGKEAVKESENQVEVSISIEQIKADITVLNEAKQQLLPDSDYLLEPTMISFDENDSAFDVLQNACEQNNIQLEFSQNIDGSIYVEGIGNLYEMDASDMSGWLFKINGEMASVGADSYIVEANDQLNWYYCVDYMKEFE